MTPFALHGQVRDTGIAAWQRIITPEVKRITSELELLKSLVRADAEAYVVVVTGGVDVDHNEASISSAARLLRLNDDDVKRVFNLNQVTPVARLSSPEEADRLRQELQAFQLESITVPESDLRLGEEGKRIRALILSDHSLTGVTTQKDARVTASYEDIRLIVQGRLFLQRVEAEENKRGGRTKLSDRRELSSDDCVLDIYSRTTEVNWRIVASNFDFSCLGARKRATAFENFGLLVELLSERARAPYDDAYIRSRQLLNLVWPLEQRITKERGRRSRAGKSGVATITITDNEGQFTRYSRLRHYLTCNELTTR